MLWACGYAKGGGREGLKLEIPAPGGDGEVDAVFGRFEGDGHRVDGWEDTRCLLVWARERLEKSGGGGGRFCGVVSGAVDVLKALGERGDERGWF